MGDKSATKRKGKHAPFFLFKKDGEEQLLYVLHAFQLAEGNSLTIQEITNRTH